MRQQSQEVTIDYEEKKHAYDSMAAGLESNNAKLESVRDTQTANACRAQTFNI